MNQRTGASGPVLFWGAFGTVAFAPLVWGGNRPWPLLMLECTALAMLGAIAFTRLPSLPATLRWGMGLLLLVPLIQLLPVPASWWAALPGHAPYAAALDAAGGSEGWRSITIHRRATEYAWLALLPCVAIFLAVQTLDRREVRALLLAFVAVVAGEAVLGILQVGSSKESLLHLGNPWGGGGVATGTYINKNHFAGLMAMGLPILVAFWAAATLAPRDRGGERLRSHPRHADAQLARRIGWSLLIMLVIAALLFTRSRAGIGCGLAAFAAAGLGLATGGGSKAARVLLAMIAVAAFMLAAYVGLTPVLERFAPDELSLSYEGRIRIAAAAMRGALEFLPLGSGLGTLADVFRRYQDEGIIGFVDHAHNDYAEAFLELGVAGLAIVTLFVLAYAMRWSAILRRQGSRTLGFLQASAGIAVAALAIHGGFDFNFHIPANAIYFSFLAGVFFLEPPS